jgi:hypothetical protein
MNKRNGYDLDRDLGPILRGDVVVPNWQDRPLAEAVAIAVAWGHPTYARIWLKGSAHTRRAIVCLAKGQGGQLTGEGMVLLEDQYPHFARAGMFALCLHSKVDRIDANHVRGWHPGQCGLCGVDLSLDSGD